MIQNDLFIIAESAPDDMKNDLLFRGNYHSIDYRLYKAESSNSLSATVILMNELSVDDFDNNQEYH